MWRWRRHRRTYEAHAVPVAIYFAGVCQLCDRNGLARVNTSWYCMHHLPDGVVHETETSARRAGMSEPMVASAVAYALALLTERTTDDDETRHDGNPPHRTDDGA
jgi:hypothetical protein